MPSTPSARLRLELQGQGESLNTWGQKLNQNALSLLDQAVAGVTPITVTGDFALSATNYAADQHRSAVLVLNGTPAAPFTVTVPGTEKVWTVVNNTGQSATFKTAAGTGAVVAGGDKATVYCDGTHCGLASLTTAQVNALIAAAGLSGALPNPAGNAGEYLRTDGTGVFWDAVPAVDLGGGAGAVITASTALTAASAVVQPVVMASNGQSVTLPDATGLSTGGRKFVVANKGDRTFAIRAHGGGLLAAVAAGGVAEMHLDDNATAAGGWTVTGRGLEPALVLVDHTFPATYTQAAEGAVRLTDALSLHFVRNASGHLFAAAADSAAGAVGTPTAIDTTTSSAYLPLGFRLSDTSAVVFWSWGGGGLRGAVLTVDPATRAVTLGVVSSAATGVNYEAALSYSGRPLVAELKAGSYVLMGHTLTPSINAIAILVTGTAVNFGAWTALPGIGTLQTPLVCHRASDTTALAVYVDDSGTAGAPYSLRAVVLSVSGTTITVGTSAGINDVVVSGTGTVVEQLTPTSYLAAYAASGSPSAHRAVRIGVSGTTVTFGTPLLVETFTAGASSLTYAQWGANRFQPNLRRLSDTTALLTCGDASANAPSRHVVLTNSGGTLTAGPILHGLWAADTGGNLPQTPAGFLAFKTVFNAYNPAEAESLVHGIGISGTALAVNNTVARAEFALALAATHRFGLSGGVCGIAQQTGGYVSSPQDAWNRVGVWHLFRNAAGRAVYLGPFSLPDQSNSPTSLVAVELAANKAAFVGLTRTNASGATARGVKLCIVEFPQ